MRKKKVILLATHIVYRKKPPHDPLAGPYTAVRNVLEGISKQLSLLYIPLESAEGDILFGRSNNIQKIRLPGFLGRSILKYILDVIINLVYGLVFLARNYNANRLIVAIDPLTCVPYVLLRKFFNFRLIFYCVDFNTHRFANKLLQYCYVQADRMSSISSDETWVVSEHLKAYKKRHYDSNSIYVPNSSIFDDQLYKKNIRKRRYNKLVWGGSCITKKQMTDLLRVIKGIQSDHRRDLQVYLAPTDNYEEYEKQCMRYKLKRTKILRLTKDEWLDLVARCDVGIAVYDPNFGSTEFIEPLKIWDFMKSGLPFIISREPPISESLRRSGAVYRLLSRNRLPMDDSLKKFLSKKTLIAGQKTSITLAKKYDMKTLITQTLNKFM